MLTAIKSTGITADRNILKDLTNGAAMEDILEMYNAVAKLDLQGSNTTSTKTAIKNAINRIAGTVKSMEKDLQAIIDITIKVASFQRYNFKLFQAYNLYNIIDTQLSGNQLIVITDEELLINQKKLITYHPTWYSMSADIATPTAAAFGDDTTEFGTAGDESVSGGPGRRPPPDGPPRPGFGIRNLFPFFDRASRPEESAPVASSDDRGPGPPGAPAAKAKAKIPATPKPVIIPPLTPPPQPKGKSKAKAVTPEIAPTLPSAPPPPPPPGAKEAAVPAASKAAQAASSSQEPMGTWIQEAADMAAQAAMESNVTNTKSFK